ncbi:MAG: alpha/beta fold hydrolase, partial [Mycobacterium sp.]
IRRIAPELSVLAVDLPGRRSKPGDLRTLTIADCVNSIVADIEQAGVDDVVVVGHSLAGIIAPAVAAKLGAGGVARHFLDVLDDDDRDKIASGNWDRMCAGIRR